MAELPRGALAWSAAGSWASRLPAGCCRLSPARAGAGTAAQIHRRAVINGVPGVRARDGRRLVDDFHISFRGRVVAGNAPSPAATSSLAIAEHLVELVLADHR